MKSIKLTIYICVALLPYIVACMFATDCTLDQKQFKMKLDEIADSNGTVNSFKLSKNGYMACGTSSILYKGTHPGNFEVALKFTPMAEKAEAEDEYAMLTYLHAIDNPEVESYGIPNVYYYGTWDEYIVMAITLLDPEFNENFNKKDVDSLDVLILCKEFVRISKYIHSCGVYHNDIAARNIMFRGNNGFIIDFNVAQKMYNTSRIDDNALYDGIQMAKTDWLAFLKFTCENIGVRVPLYTLESDSEVSATIDKIGYKSHDDLSRVLVSIAEYIFYVEDVEGSYDRIYHIIDGEIDSFETPLLHWLRDTQLGDGSRQLNPIKPISSIRDPFTLTRIDYPVVNFEYFNEKASRKGRNDCKIM